MTWKHVLITALVVVATIFIVVRVDAIRSFVGLAKAA